jgi:hypothetical protein
MTENASSRKKSDAQDLKEHTAVFGYDQDGRTHHWNPVTATVVVTVDGDVEHTEELSREAVPEWIAFVDQQCGWIDQWWHAKRLNYERYRAAKAQAADIRYNRTIESGQEATA